MSENKKKPTKTIKDKKPNSQDLQQQLDIAQQSTKDNWDKLLRSQAEMENLKRRHTKDLENAHKFALLDFAKSLLEVKDSMTMGLKTAQQEAATVSHIVEGLQMTDKIFINTLQKFGVEIINPENEEFNPEFHEAVTAVAAAGKSANSIVEVVQVGFTLNARLLRPAMVIVAQ
ncbi:MAG: nucleotide exchange factor GrpE [Candidatus Thioglobus sp.]|nr:nucleotide exchange factor GrpE [Candidatus Thioglobus sp.]